MLSRLSATCVGPYGSDDGVVVCTVKGRRQVDKIYEKKKATDSSWMQFCPVAHSVCGGLDRTVWSLTSHLQRLELTYSPICQIWLCRSAGNYLIRNGGRAELLAELSSSHAHWMVLTTSDSLAEVRRAYRHLLLALEKGL